ncbi:MAG: beta-lactamase family protein [Planctomycetes bacterium]|nr:beta-lactamase family protein [Planctomycetota bacterium]
MLAAVVLVAFAASPQEPRPSTFDFTMSWKDVEAQFHRECDAAGVVGAGLVFVKGRNVEAFAGHGYADRAGKRVVDLDTNFHWASCTKTFTAIAVLQLRDRGLLKLEQPIVELVPELRDVRDPFGPITAITVQHLLTHSAGFRGATWPWGGDQDWHPHEPTQWSQLVAMLPYTTVEFAPGSKFSYSNPGIVFLGRAIERLTGDEYEVHMEKNVLRPLGMTRTYFDTTPWHLQRFRSHSYDGKGDAAKDLGPDFDTGITVSNGGLNASLADMAKYLSFLLGAVPEGSDAAGVLARASLESMWQPVLPTRPDGKEHIGLGFFVQEHGGTRFATHTGGQRSFVSFFYVHPASGTAACAAFNTGTAGPAMAKVRSLCMQALSLAMRRN